MRLSGMCLGAPLPAVLLQLGVTEGVGGTSAHPLACFLTQTLHGSLGPCRSQLMEYLPFSAGLLW